MTSRIRRLPPLVVDRIAAGEVVERPASVVKELVENALDAGAERIDVEIRTGGCDLVLVADDGIGMGCDDLALAFVSHATSKLTEVGDLDHIASFGFRGEALASVGAVADCRIVSRERGESHGHAIESSGGEIGDVEVAAAREGTRVEVRNLFRYVPARRKFLRTPATEASHVTAAVQRLAVANPGVAFSLTRDGRAAFRVAATEGRRERVAKLYGRRLFESLLAVEEVDGDLRLEGFVAPPSEARGSTAAQHLFLNGRPIRDRSLLHAVRHAYEGLLTRGRHPVAFLFVECAPGEVDVNVHPAKTEVRFRDGERMHRLVRRAVRRALLGSDLTPEFVPDAARAPAESSGIGVREPYLDGVRDALADFLTRPAAGDAAFRPRSGMSTGSNAGPGAAPSRAAHTSTALRTEPKPAVRYLQVADTFLVFETEGGIAIVDQHALHERILLEEISERVAKGSLEVQPLLVPAIVELPSADVEALLGARDELERLGVRLERFGETEVAVQSLPAMLSGRDPGKLVRALAERVGAGRGVGNRHQLHDTLLHSMACRSAVMAGDRLSESQAAELLRRADLIDNSQGCAHGRPTALRVSFRELYRHFKR